MVVMDEAILLAPKRVSSDDLIAALLPGLRERSTVAWGDLYDHFAPNIHWFAVTLLLGDVETAKDVVVDTMADAARRIERFDPRRSSLAAWLYGVARRRVQIELRWQRRLKSMPAWAQLSMESMAQVGDGRDMAADAAKRMDAQRKVADLATVLSPMEMEILALSCVDGVSLREIGHIVGRSEQAVNSILYRARRKARERLMADDD